jgi:mono/diheme cytochrome c family protein
LVWLAAACILCGQAGPSRYVTEVGGKALFEAHCATCHGTDGRGAGPVAAALKSKIPDLRMLARRSKGKFPREAVEQTILGEGGKAAHGSREMPVWGPAFSAVNWDRDMSKVRVKNVTDYIESLQVK